MAQLIAKKLDMINKVCMGTVQMELNYGINNLRGKRFHKKKNHLSSSHE